MVRDAQANMAQQQAVQHALQNYSGGMQVAAAPAGSASFAASTLMAGGR